MNASKQLTADDGHKLGAYVAHPEHEPVGAIVVIQEIFGVNGHIRSVADRFAREGFLAIAPALFDRIGRESEGRSIELTYEGEDQKRAYELMQKLSPATALLDIAAAFELAKASGKGVGVVGFCYGGLMSWLTATRGETLKMRPDCCVGYYPGGIGRFALEEPSCPLMLHFGAEDTHIGQDQIEAVREAHPGVEVFLYEGAGHAFNCDARTSYNAPSAKIAWNRTIDFLKSHIA